MGLLPNFFGARRARNPAPSATLGEPGTAIFGGYVQNNEKSSDVSGQKRYTTYSEALANTAIVASGTRLFLNFVASTDWRAKPADSSDLALDIADFVMGAMGDMETAWYRVIRRAAMLKFYGFQIQEWTAKLRDDGLIGMLNVAPRPQYTIEQWDRDEHGRVVGAVQRSPQTGETIYLPRGKIIYAVDDALSDSPEGLGLFRHIVPSVHRLERFEELEAYNLETDLRGVPVITAPLQALNARIDGEEKFTVAHRDAILAPLKLFAENHIRGKQTGLVMDSAMYETKDEKGAPSAAKQYDIKLLATNSTAQPALASAITRMNHDIARILNVEHLLLGENRGTQALSRDKTDQFALVVDSTISELVETFQKDYVRPLMKLNGFPLEMEPKLETETLQWRDLTQLSQTLDDLAKAGAPLDPTDPVIDMLRVHGGMPPRPDDLLEAMAEDAAIRPASPAAEGEEETPDEAKGEEEE